MIYHISAFELLERPSSLIERLESKEDDPVNSADLKSGTLCCLPSDSCPMGEGEGVGELGNAEKVTRGSLHNKIDRIKVHRSSSAQF